jgi:NAD(P)-dependent dehydrogenase (short-subunit alcohol dehydrogenase family)
MKILLGDLSATGMDDTRQLIAGDYPDVKIETKVLDVSNEASVEEFYSFAVSEFGSIDYAANVAGIGSAATPVHQAADSVFEKVYSVNQRGVSSGLVSGYTS